MNFINTSVDPERPVGFNKISSHKADAPDTECHHISSNIKEAATNQVHESDRLAWLSKD